MNNSNISRIYYGMLSGGDGGGGSHHHHRNDDEMENGEIDPGRGSNIVNYNDEHHQCTENRPAVSNSFTTTATLEISSTTIINSNNNNNNSATNNNEIGGWKTPNNPIIIKRQQQQQIMAGGSPQPIGNDILHQMEYHFNPLYIISDGSNDPATASSSNGNANGATGVAAAGNNNLVVEDNHHHHQRLFCPPSDRYGLIYVALLMAGIGFLLPYNSFMIAVDYFQKRFPHTTIIFDMSTTYILFAFVTVIIQNFFVETIPLIWRLNLGYFLSFIFMLFVVIYEIWARLGTYLDNLVVISIIAIGCTIQQSTFYGYTSMLPKRYVQAVMTGESAAGIFVSLNRIATKILYPDDPEFNTMLFFSISIVVILICAVVHLVVLPRSDFIRYHIFLCNQHQSHHRHYRQQDDGDDRILHQINENVGLVNMYHNNEMAAQQQLPLTNHTSSHQHRSSLLSNESDFEPPAVIVAAGGSSTATTTTTFRNRYLPSNVQNMLRTDSSEMVFPFGIDDEEIGVETTQANYQPQEFSELTATTNDNSDYSISFKTTPSARSLLVRWLHSLESATHWLYHLRRAFRRLRKCDENLNRFMETLRQKYYTRKTIVKRVWPYIISIMLVYFVTLTIFPGIESEIYSCHYGDWLPIILMATFNLSDFVGKLLSTLFYRINKHRLLAISLARLALIPLFALTITPRTDPFFSNPFWPILLSIFLGLSNGILGSLPMILAPLRVNEQNREITGNLMTFSYIIGLTSGSLASYALNDWSSYVSRSFGSNITEPEQLCPTPINFNEEQRLPLFTSTTTTTTTTTTPMVNSLASSAFPFQ